MPESPSPSPSPVDLLQSLLSTFKPVPKGQRVAKPKAAKTPAPRLPLASAWNLRKTGYRVWNATGRVILLQDQVCSCCSTRTTAVKDELFELENTTAHSVWLRHEGFGIEAQEDLPIRFEYAPELRVSACGACVLPDLDFAIAQLLNRTCVQLSFPF